MPWPTSQHPGHTGYWPRPLTHPTKSRARRRANPRNMKKTTAKGAYKPARKNQMVKRRNPIVETLQDLRENWYNPTDPADETTSLYPSHMNWQYLGIGNDISTPDAYIASAPAEPTANAVPAPRVNQSFPVDVYNQKQVWLGANLEPNPARLNAMMKGNQIFAKSLYVKIQLRLPQQDGLIDFPQCKMYLVHGWIRAPLRRTQKTTPTEDAVEPSDYMQAHIVQQIDEYFDSDQDRLQWKPNTPVDNAIDIVGYKRLHFNADKSVIQPQMVYNGTAIQDTGVIPDKELSLTWKLNRKLTYTKGALKDPEGGAASNAINQRPYYINGQHLPFWMIYMPGGERLKFHEHADNRIQIRFNERLDFTDG